MDSELNEDGDSSNDIKQCTVGNYCPTGAMY
jgi:hypothetical protein